VRSLIADLGDAYCEQLRRTTIGPFTLEEADPERIVPPDEALARIGLAPKGGPGGAG
jgi:tRNA pseudouridine55 synthase